MSKFKSIEAKINDIKDLCTDDNIQTALNKLHSQLIFASNAMWTIEELYIDIKLENNVLDMVGLEEGNFHYFVHVRSIQDDIIYTFGA